MTSRRVTRGVTARLPCGSVIMPHHFQVPIRVLRQQQHLARFYSAAALEAILKERSLDADVALEAGDVLSHKAIRRRCLELVAEGSTSLGSLEEAPEAAPEAWPLGAWETALDGAGLSLLYAEDVLECLSAGRPAWSRLPCDFGAPPCAAPALLQEAARHGVLAFVGRSRVDDALYAYEHWACSRALLGAARCALIGSATLYGVHWPVAKIVLLEVPASYEAAIHLCGRTARREATVFFRSREDAAKVMSPPAEYNAGDAAEVLPGR